MSTRLVVFRRGRLVGSIAACLFLFLSCNGNDAGPGGSAGPDALDSPAILPSPRVSLRPDIRLTSETAQGARALVNAQLNMVAYATRGCPAPIATVNGKTWEKIDGGCWSKEMGAPPGEGCASTVRACVRDSRCTYTEIIDGLCLRGPYFQEYTQWMHLRVETDLDAEVGEFLVYEDRAHSVDLAWTWECDDESGSETWFFYNGKIEIGNQFARLTRVRTEDGVERATWTWSTIGKWESEIAQAGKSGSMIVYQWPPAGAEWYRAHEIDWAGGGGTWISFDDAGAVVAERSW